MQRVGLNQVQLAALIGSTKQQIGRFATGNRIPTVEDAKRIAPHLQCDWKDLLERQPSGQIAPDVEHGVVVIKGDPQVGDPINDVDEAALLATWRKLSFFKRCALFVYLGFNDMPSLRKLQ